MRKKFGLAGILFVFMAFVLPTVVGTFAMPTSAQAAVTGVIIQGNVRVERETILSYLQFAATENLSLIHI